MKRRDVVEKDFPGKRHFEANHVRAMRFPVEKLLCYYRELDGSEPCYPCRSTFVCFLFSSLQTYTLDLQAVFHMQGVAICQPLS